MDLVNLHNVIVNAEDLRVPVHLSDQLNDSSLNSDVQQSMMQLLQVSHKRVSWIRVEGFRDFLKNAQESLMQLQ